MNCQDFKSISSDLAFSRTIESSVRESGLAHAKACPQCSAHLANEQALAEGLRALAASTMNEEAPADIERVLREAFRKLTPIPSGARYGSRWILGAAAVILMVLILTVWRLQKTSSPPMKAEMADPTTQSAVEPRAPLLVPTAVNPKKKSAQQTSRRDMSKRARQIVSRSKVQPELSKGGERKEVRNSNGHEMATDFIPFIYGDHLTPPESGQVVRIELPRSALLEFGLPMNIERAREPIQADVLLGEDGVAYAIRFVR